MQRPEVVLLLWAAVQQSACEHPGSNLREQCRAKHLQAEARHVASCLAMILMYLVEHRMVRGLDATAAQSFGSLRNLLQRLNVELIIVELENESASALLTAHGVIGPAGCRCEARLALLLSLRAICCMHVKAFGDCYYLRRYSDRLSLPTWMLTCTVVNLLLVCVHDGHARRVFQGIRKGRGRRALLRGALPGGRAALWRARHACAACVARGGLHGACKPGMGTCVGREEPSADLAHMWLSMPFSGAGLTGYLVVDWVILMSCT